MKKKTLITIMVVILSLVLVLTAVSCKPRRQPDPDPDPTPKTEKAKFSAVFNTLLESAEKTFYNVGNVSDAAYYAATLYFELENGTGDDKTEVKYDITIKGNFSETIADNSGFFEVKDTAENQVLLSAYVEQSTVYIGEAFTVAPVNKSLNWFKLDQIDSSNFIADFFSQLPAFVEKEIKPLTDDNIITAPKNKTLSLVIGSLPSLGGSVFEYKHPDDYLKGNINGAYSFELETDKINTLVTGFGSLLEALPAEYLPAINMLLPTLLGIELKKEGDTFSVVPAGDTTPVIKFDFEVKDDAMSKLGIYYANDDLSLSFGVKNVAASTAKTDVKPSYMPATVGDGALKLTVDLGVAQKELALTVDAYIIPDITLDYTETDGFTFGWSGLKGYAVGSVDGEKIDLEAFYDADNGFAIELAGLYTLLGATAPAEGTVYYNKDLTLVPAPEESASNAEADPEADPRDTSTHTLDVLINSIKAAFSKGGDLVGFVTGKFSNVLDVVKVVSSAINSAIDMGEDDDGEAILDLVALLDAAKNLKFGDDNLVDSEYIKGLLGADAAKYFEVETLISEIAKGLKISVAELEANVAHLTGLDIGDKSLAEYITDNGLEVVFNSYFGETANGGAGFAIELKSGEESIGKIGIKAQFITVANATIEEFDFETTTGLDLSESANWDLFLDELLNLARAGDFLLEEAPQ